ncbi:hypothetical protein ES703_83950 [subsurface metagenome]
MPLHVAKVNAKRYTFGNNVHVRYNPTKDRAEWWARCAEGNQAWVLKHVRMGRTWEDSFMSAPGFLAAILGYQSQIPWAVSGVIDGAGATADPAAGNFIAANEIGGGLNMIAGDTVGATGDTGDFTALQWGDNYPTMLRTSPHVKTTFSPILLTTCFFFGGLTDNTRPAARAAFALPNNGVFAYYDTTVDGDAHLIIRSGAVSVTDVALGAPGPGEHRGVHIQTADDGLSIQMIVQGNVVSTLG